MCASIGCVCCKQPRLTRAFLASEREFRMEDKNDACVDNSLHRPLFTVRALSQMSRIVTERMVSQIAYLWFQQCIYRECSMTSLCDRTAKMALSYL